MNAQIVEGRRVAQVLPAELDTRLGDVRLLRETPRFTVYEGTWRANGERCVLKIGRDPRHAAVDRTHFRAEARILSLLEGVSGVPRLFDLDLPSVSLVNSRSPGLDLLSMPQDRLQDLTHTIRIGISIATVLRDVHTARVFHGNINPSNIIVDAETDEATLVNFGDAVAQSHVDVDYVHPTMLGRLLPFSAPEQSGRMGRAVDYRADLYSLGAVLYWSLTGRPPFVEAEPLAMLHAVVTRMPASPEQFNPNVPAVLGAIVLKLLAKNPQDRYQSAHGVLVDLQHCLASLAAGSVAAGFAIAASDRRIKPAQPSRLFGREHELALIGHVLDASVNRCRVVLVHGFSGAGKTALVRGMYPLLSRRNGIFAGGRYDEYQRLTPFRGISEALCDLAEYWLSEAPEVLESLRSQLHSALGANVAALVRLAPAFERVLWATRQGYEELEDSTPNLLARLGQALASVFQVVRQRGNPLVLFIDNLQWADSGSLELFESAALHESTAPVLLVGAYRSNEVSTAHPLDAVLAHIRSSGTEVLDIVADNLDANAVQTLVADVLVGDNGDGPADPNGSLDPLAQTLYRRTLGNPFFVLQYLRQLFDAGHLHLEGERWSWNEEAVDALPGSDNLVAGLLRELEDFPPEVKSLAGGCACLGGAIDVDILAAVLEQPLQRVDGWLLPLLQRDMLLATRSADLVDADGTTIAARGGSKRVRFCHDRMQHAAYATLTEEERSQWHLGIARVLGSTNVPPNAAVGHRFAVTSHYLSALDRLADAVEKASVFSMLLNAARDGITRAAFDTAMRFAQGAERLLVSGSANDAVLALLLTKHRVLCGLARHEEADTVFAELSQLPGIDSVAISVAIELQMTVLAARMWWSEACELALHHIAKLGVEVPDVDRYEAAAQTQIDAIYAVLAQRGDDAFDRLEPLTDARGSLAVTLMAAVGFLSVRCQPLLSWWAPLRGLMLSVEHGRSPVLPWLLLEAGRMVGLIRQDRATGYALGQTGLRIQALNTDPWRMARNQIIGCRTTFWFEPIDVTLEATRSARRVLMQAADSEFLAYAYVDSIPKLVEVGGHIDLAFDEVAEAFETSRRMREHYGPTVYIGVRQFLRCMAGLTQTTGSFGDTDFDEASALANFGKNFRAKVRYCGCRALAAVIFGDWATALEYSAIGCGAMGRFAIGYHDLQLQWVRALALAHALRGSMTHERVVVLEELDPLVAVFAQHAVEMPTNYSHMYELLRALRAWADEDFRAAAVAFENAGRDALAHRRLYPHALASELAAEFYEAHGLTSQAKGPFRLAVHAYQEWGADGKVAQMRQHPLFTGVGAAPAKLDADEDAVTPNLEVIGLAEAGRLISQERDPEQLPALLFDLVRRYAAAERGRLLWLEGEDWREIAGFTPVGQWINLASAASVSSDGQLILPASVLNYLIQSQQPLLLPNVTRHARYGQDPEVQRLRIKSVFAWPIQHRGQLVGLLYLDNLQTYTQLEPPQAQLVGLLALQFAVAFENALAHRDLQVLVERRTAQLQRRTVDLERSRASLQAIIDSSQAMISLKDPSGLVLLHNRRWALNTAGADESFVGRHLSELRAGDASAQLSTEIDAEVYTANQPRRFEFNIVVDGESRTFRSEKFPVADPAGQTFAVGTVSVDVTDLQRAWSTAEEATRAKSEFLANMSHEIRTPLNAVIGLTRLALKNEMSTKVRDYVLKIEQSGQHLLGVVNDILDFSKIEAGKLQIEAVPFNLESLIENALGAVSESLDSKGIELICHLDPRLPAELTGDPLRIGQILLNYLSNAAKFTDCGEVLLAVDLLETRTTEVSLKFTVTDTGIGLNPEQIGRLFKWFEQADTYTTRQYGGTGLGLVISRSLAQAMGGDVGVTSVVGQGSEFWFTATLGLPSPSERGRDPVARMRGARALLHAASVHSELEKKLALIAGARILVVEDNETNQQIAAEILQGLGFEIDVASNGRIAVDQVQARHAQGRPYHLVLMDMQMPVMDGLTATRLIREKQDCGEVPIVAMTANAMPVDQARCLAAGMNDFVSKPIGVESLYAALLKCIEPRAASADASANGVAPDAAAKAAEAGSWPSSPNLAELQRSGLDVKQVLEMTGLSAASYFVILRKFAAHLPRQMAQLQDALQRQDTEAALHSTHAIKGAASNMGAQRLEIAIRDLEILLERGSAKATTSAFERALLLQEALIATIDSVRINQ